MKDLETRRQLIHLSGALIALGISRVGWSIGVAVLTIALISTFVVSKLYKVGVKLPVFAKVIDLAERPGVVLENPAAGTLSFFLGSLVTLLVFSFDFYVACASIMILGAGDSISTLFGKRFGRRRIPYNPEKSVEGSLAGTFAAVAGASILVPAEIAVIGGIGGMFAESLPAGIDDNLLVPLFAGAAMSLGIYVF